MTGGIIDREFYRARQTRDNGGQERLARCPKHSHKGGISPSAPRIWRHPSAQAWRRGRRALSRACPHPFLPSDARLEGSLRVQRAHSACLEALEPDRAGIRVTAPPSPLLRPGGVVGVGGHGIHLIGQPLWVGADQLAQGVDLLHGQLTLLRIRIACQQQEAARRAGVAPCQQGADAAMGAVVLSAAGLVPIQLGGQGDLSWLSPASRAVVSSTSSCWASGQAARARAQAPAKAASGLALRGQRAAEAPRRPEACALRRS